jgi:hypothetical protein
VKLYKVIPHPFYGWGYQALSRLLHRLNLHYAPAKFMPNNGRPMVSRWCQWCGMRSHEPWWPPGTTLEQRLERLQQDREAKAL